MQELILCQCAKKNLAFSEGHTVNWNSVQNCAYRSDNISANILQTLLFYF